MNTIDILIRLASWSYLRLTDAVTAAESGAKETDPLLKAAVGRFKERWGAKYDLPVGDCLDNETVALMERRFCQCSDSEPEQVGGNLRRWASRLVTWRDRGVQVGNLNFQEAMKFTANATAKVCGMQLTIVGGAGSPNIESFSKPLDGKGGTLAQAYLPGYPSSSSARLTQEYDTAEGGLGQHAFNMVCLHETGHSLGLSHDNTRDVAVMDPFLNASLREWQPADIRELVARYGEPEVNTTPQPTPTPGNNGQAEKTLAITGTFSKIVIPGYRVTKLD